EHIRIARAGQVEWCVRAEAGRLERAGACQQILARRRTILELWARPGRQRQHLWRSRVAHIIECAAAGCAAELIAPGAGHAAEGRALPAEAERHRLLPGHTRELNTISHRPRQQGQLEAGAAAGEAASLRPIACAAPADSLRTTKLEL